MTTKKLGPREAPNFFSPPSLLSLTPLQIESNLTFILEFLLSAVSDISKRETEN